MFEYEATHMSRHDGSPAMALPTDPGTLVLVNEDGYVWIAEPENWKDLSKINAFTYFVTVVTETQEQADTIIAERLENDEDYGFEYTVDYVRESK